MNKLILLATVSVAMLTFGSLANAAMPCQTAYPGEYCGSALVRGDNENDRGGHDVGASEPSASESSNSEPDSDSETDSGSESTEGQCDVK